MKLGALLLISAIGATGKILQRQKQCEPTNTGSNIEVR